MVIQTGSAKVNNGEDRKAVLLLHGLGVYGRSWWHQIQALREHGYFPLAPDLPGFGATPAGQGRWSVKNAAASAIKVLDQIGIDKAVVCGLSMGGWWRCNWLSRPRAVGWIDLDQHVFGAEAGKFI